MATRAIRLKVTTLGDLVKAIATYHSAVNTKEDTSARILLDEAGIPSVQNLLVDHFDLDSVEDLRNLPLDTPLPKPVLAKARRLLTSTTVRGR